MREAGKGLRDQGRDVRIHRPGQRQIALGAELASGHEHDVRNLRQRLDRGFVEQVAIDGLDAARLQPVLDGGIAEAGDADDAALRHGGLGKARQRRSHLAGNAQDHDVAVDLAEIVDQRLARAAQQFVERQRYRKSSPAGCRGSAACLLPSYSYCSRMSRTTNIRSRPSTSPYSATPSNVRSTTAITIAGVSSEDCTWIMR